MTLPTRVERGDEPLTVELLRARIDYDPESGVLTWQQRRAGVVVGREIGHLEADGYMRFDMDHRHYMVHRVAWFHTHGRWPEPYLDHIDRNRSNNRLSNLREATRQLNMQNRGASRSAKSPLVGAHWDGERNCWLARIQTDGRTKHLGRFPTDTEAHAAYMAAKPIYHPQAVNS